MGLPTTIRARLCRADDGFSLIEAVVALVILSVVATAFAYGSTLTLQVTRDVRLRQQATHLMERELEIARNHFKHADEVGQAGVVASGTKTNANPLPGGTAGQPLAVDGREFTVVRTHTVQVNGEGQSACDGGGSVDYLTIAVNVRVSWSDSGRASHLDGKTLLTPVKGVDNDLGYLAAKLTGATGAGTDGVTVTATGPGGSQVRTTVGDGCAVFVFSTAGTYGISLDEPGYVNSEGFQAVTKSAALELGKLKVVPFSYDEAAQVQVEYVSEPGHTLPAPLPGITLFNAGLPAPGELHAQASGDTASKSSLWPFTDGYSIWAGTCDQSDPSLSPGRLRPPSLAVGAGDAEDAEVYLAAVRIKAITVLGQDAPGVALEAVPLDASGCEGADATMSLGVTDGNGDLEFALPAGQWQVRPQGSTVCAWIECPVDTGELFVTDAAGVPPAGTVTVLPDIRVWP